MAVWFGSVGTGRHSEAQEGVSSYFHIKSNGPSGPFSFARECRIVAELRSTVPITYPLPSVWCMSVVVPNSDEGTDSVLTGTSAIAHDITAQVQLL